MTKFADLPEKTLLRPDEVALFFQVRVKTVYGWIDTGKLDATKVGKVLRIYRESVIKLTMAGQ